MITKCKTCNKILALNETAWACGPMFCSHECGVNWAKTKYEASEYMGEIDLHIKATAYFNDIAEEINREDYGAKVDRWSVYSPDSDITTVFNTISENDTLICTKVTGFYHGEKSKELDKEFDGKAVAWYVDKED